MARVRKQMRAKAKAKKAGKDGVVDKGKCCAKDRKLMGELGVIWEILKRTDVIRI